MFEGRNMKRSEILCVSVFLLVLASPIYAFAIQKPLPGKWEAQTIFLKFHEPSSKYVSIAMQDSDDEIKTMCLLEKDFLKASFHIPKFLAENDTNDKSCQPSQTKQSPSATIWNQTCTDRYGEKQDEKITISIESKKINIEHDIVTTTSVGEVVKIKYRNIEKLKRIGGCDKPK